MTNATGANDFLAQHLLGEIIANGVTIHLLSADQAYTDGNTALTADSEATQTVTAANMTVNAATDFTDVATLTNDNQIDFDVSGITASTVISHLATQDSTNTDRFVLSDETNDPDIGTLDTYTIPAGTVLYEFGNPV